MLYMVLCEKHKSVPTKNKTAKMKLPSIANLIELMPKQTPINVSMLGKMYRVLFTETTLNLFFFSI